MMLRAILVVTMALGVAVDAGAQDTRAEAQNADTQTHHARLEQPCAASEGLTLCVNQGIAARLRPRAPKPVSGHLTRFTRLAGMFMGRVDAADIGPLKVRFNLELR